MATSSPSGKLGNSASLIRLAELLAALHTIVLHSRLHYVSTKHKVAARTCSMPATHYATRRQVRKTMLTVLA